MTESATVTILTCPVSPVTLTFFTAERAPSWKTRAKHDVLDLVPHTTETWDCPTVKRVPVWLTFTWDIAPPLARGTMVNWLLGSLVTA